MIPRDMSTKCLVKKTLGNERQRTTLEEADRIYTKSRLSAFITHESEKKLTNATEPGALRVRESCNLTTVSSQQPLFSPIRPIRNQTLDERT